MDADGDSVALSEFRRSRKQIEKKLSKLQEDTAAVANIITSPNRKVAGGTGSSPVRSRSPNKR